MRRHAVVSAGAMLSQDVVFDALEGLFPGEVLEEKDYISSMIAEESPKDLETLFDLVGEFLLEVVDDDRELAHEKCQTLFEALVQAAPAEFAAPEDGAGGDGSPKHGPDAGDAADGKKKTMRLGEMLGGASEEAGGFQDAFMGIDRNTANYNEVVQIGDVVAKRKAAATKDRAAVMNRMKEWQKQKLKPPAPVRIHRGEEQIAKITDLVIDKFGVSVGGKELIADTTLKLVSLVGGILGLCLVRVFVVNMLPRTRFS